jgi:hypothetical protein
MSSNRHILPPSLLLTVKILIPASRKDEFLSHMRPAFDAAMAEKECCYFILGSRDTELKGFLEGGGQAEFEGNEKGEEAVEVWWTEGWRIEGESRDPKGWKEGAEWLMNVSTKLQLPSMECCWQCFPKGDGWKWRAKYTDSKCDRSKSRRITTSRIWKPLRGCFCVRVSIES